MKFPLVRICAWSLGIALLWFSPSCTSREAISVEVANQNQSDRTEIIAALTQANIIYLGENHASATDHQAQLEIIQTLYAQQTKIAIALEMFQRPYQQFLDLYLAGEITEAQLKQKTEYEQRWGYDWEFYAPILRFAKAHNLPLIALNTPTEITRKVAQSGLAGLSESDWQYIPPQSEIDLSDTDYQALLRSIYDRHLQDGHGNSDGFQNFFLAQVLWDETMAEKIVDFYQQNPDYQIVTLAGRGHVIYDYGIPNRVQRRLANADFTDVSVLFGDSPELSTSSDLPAADYLW